MLTNVLKPYPEKIQQWDNQLVLYFGKVHFYSPYETRSYSPTDDVAVTNPNLSLRLVLSRFFRIQLSSFFVFLQGLARPSDPPPTGLAGPCQSCPSSCFAQCVGLSVSHAGPCLAKADLERVDSYRSPGTLRMLPRFVPLFECPIASFLLVFSGLTEPSTFATKPWESRISEWTSLHSILLMPLLWLVRRLRKSCGPTQWSCHSVVLPSCGNLSRSSFSHPRQRDYSRFVFVRLSLLFWFVTIVASFVD